MLATLDIDLVRESDGEKAVETAERERPDLILLDYELPGANGVEVLARLRSHVATESTPVVFLTGNDEHKVLTQCFRAGAADYIRKPFCSPELRARVYSVLERKRMLGRLEQLALQDSLTGLYNRISICDRIQAAINRAQRSHCAVLYLDFDRFKAVNDSLGHNIGDMLLRQIANRIVASLRSKDCVGYCPERTTAARLGGDEFVVLLEDLCDPADALLVTDRLLTALADPYVLAGHQVWSTASIGVVASFGDYATTDQVLRDADTAMYEAKADGRGRRVVFDMSNSSESAGFTPSCR
jgi:diguanylate cyclase (GGDEF)-like protein